MRKYRNIPFKDRSGSTQVTIDIPMVDVSVNGAMQGLYGLSDQEYLNFDRHDIDQKTADWGMIASLVFLDQIYQSKDTSQADKDKALLYYNQLNQPNAQGTWKGLNLKGTLGKPYPGTKSWTEYGAILKTGATWRESDNSKLLSELWIVSQNALKDKKMELYNELAKIINIAAEFKVHKSDFNIAIDTIFADNPVVYWVNRGSFGTQRTALLELIKLNWFSLGHDLGDKLGHARIKVNNKANNKSDPYNPLKADIWEKISTYYVAWGGTASDLTSAVDIGFKKATGKLPGVSFDGISQDYLNVDATAIWVASATALLGVISNYLSMDTSITQGENLKKQQEIQAEIARQKALDDERKRKQKEMIIVWSIIGGGVLIVGGVIAFLIIKKNK